MKLTFASSSFREGEEIPSQHTCDGRDQSPPLSWNDPPGTTRSLALLCDDPDAGKRPFVHWVLYNLSPSTRELPEGVPTLERLPDESLQGRNDFRRIGYGGPCPPRGVHHYHFSLFALDALLTLEPGATKSQLLQAMEGHILAKGELMGTYRRG